MIKFDKVEGESINDLVKRVISHKNEIGTWDDIRDILNELTGQERTESYWRKGYKNNKSFDDIGKTTVKSNGSTNTNNSSVESVSQPTDNTCDGIDDLYIKQREIEIKTIQLRDERNALNQTKYIEARMQQKLDYLESKMREISKIEFEPFKSPTINSDNSMIIPISDLHIGQSFNNVFGGYNTDIAKDRVALYLNYVIKYAALYNVSKVYIVSLGDQISGNIHQSIQVTNRENVIDQIKIATEIIASFCYKCCKVFQDVYFYNVDGNHSRLTTNKENAIHDERLDSIIGWAVGLVMGNVKNFHNMDTKADSGICEFKIGSKYYCCVHGDYDNNNKTSMSDLCGMLGYFPYAIIKGHMHSPSYNEFNGIKVIQCGSTAGSGDQYTIEKRLTGNPSQTILVCNNSGIIAHIPVDLD